jgi:hypothetical protein
MSKQGAGNMTTIDRTNSTIEETIKQAITVVTSVGCKAEVTGVWVWVHGDTKPVKDTLKESGFRWASGKKLWYFAAVPSTGRRGGKDMSYIRTKYGSILVGNKD